MSTLLNKYENNKSSHSIYSLMCCIFCGFYFIRDIMGVGVNWYLIYAFGALTVLVVSKEEIIAFLVSIAAFANAGFNGMFAVMILMCVILRFWNELRSVKKYTLIPIGMILLETLHYNYNHGIERGVWLTYVCFLLILFIIQQYDSKKINKMFIMKSFVCFSLFFVTMTLMQMIRIYGSFESMITIGFRTNEYRDLLGEYTHLIGNSNYLTSLASLNICICAVLLSRSNNKIFLIIAFSIFMLTGLLTVSKMFVVVDIAFAAYIILFAYKKGLKYGIGLSVVLIIAVAFIYNQFQDTLIQMVSDRLLEEDWSTGRISIVETLLAYMNEHPITYITGLGILQTFNYIGRQAVHSSFFEVLGGWGIFGVVLVISYILVQISVAKKNAMRSGSKPTGLNYLPILVFLGYSLGGMLFSSSLAIIRMMIATYAIEIGGKSDI